MRREGFTLIELMAVVVILGLLAGSTSWLMTRQVRSRSIDHAVGQVAHADRMTRMAARRTDDRCVLRIDPRRGRLVRLTRASDGVERAAHPVDLPAGFSFGRILVGVPGDRTAPGGPLALAHDARPVEITYSRRGCSPSYAVRLDAKETRTWLVVSGLTGQATIENETRNVETLFAELATGRPDSS